MDNNFEKSNLDMIKFVSSTKKVGDVIVTYPSKKDAEFLVYRDRKGKFKGSERVMGVKPIQTKHKDTKSHNVNIKVMSGVTNIMDVKRDLDKSILLLENSKMASIDKNNTNYIQTKPLVFKNISEKRYFIKNYTKQVKLLKELYKNTIKNKLIK
jgi:hypothetical protein